MAVWCVQVRACIRPLPHSHAQQPRQHTIIITANGENVATALAFDALQDAARPILKKNEAPLAANELQLRLSRSFNNTRHVSVRVIVGMRQ